MHGSNPFLFLREKVFCTHLIESWISYLRPFCWLIKVLSFHICDSINSHIWNDRLTYVSWSNHICGTTFFSEQNIKSFWYEPTFISMFHRLHPFKKVSWKVLKHLEHCDFRYNIVVEAYECRACKLQHDSIKINRRVHNDISEFLSRTLILLWVEIVVYSFFRWRP